MCQNATRTLLDTPGKARWAAGGSAPNLAQTLVDFATLADREKAKLDKLPGFDLGMIEDARHVANEILTATSSPGRPASANINLRV